MHLEEELKDLSYCNAVLEVKYLVMHKRRGRYMLLILRYNTNARLSQRTRNYVLIHKRYAFNYIKQKAGLCL